MEDPVGKLFFGEWHFVDGGYHVDECRLFWNNRALHAGESVDKKLNLQRTIVVRNIKGKGLISFLIFNVSDIKFAAEAFLKLLMMVNRTFRLFLLRLEWMLIVKSLHLIKPISSS